MKKGFLLSIISLLISLLVLVTGTYAWYYLGDNYTNVDLEVVEIDTTVKLYKAVDSNYNGVPDKDVNENFLYSNLLSQEYAAIDSPTTDIKLQIAVSDMLPTQIATYKINVENNSKQSNTLKFVFQNFINPADNGGYIKMFSVRIVEVGNGEPIKHEKFYFADYLTAEGINNFNIAENLAIERKTDGSTNNTRDFWLQIEFETCDDLLANVATSENLFSSQDEQAEYQQIQGQIVKLPLLMVYVEI